MSTRVRDNKPAKEMPPKTVQAAIIARINETIGKTLNDAQHASTENARRLLVTHLLKFHKKLSTIAEVIEFHRHFRKLLSICLIEFEAAKAVDNVLMFACSFATEIKFHISQTDNQIAADDASPFLTELLGWLAQNLQACGRGVRLRSAELIGLILERMAAIIDIAEDDESGETVAPQLTTALYNRLAGQLRQRCNDPVVRVRIAAIRASKTLQDDDDPTDILRAAIMLLMANDPNADVRTACVKTLVLTKHIIPALIDRIKDVNDTVAKTAFTVLAEKVSPKALNLSQRLQMLKCGLYSKSAQLKRTCRDVLLPEWLASYKEDRLQFLIRLDVMTDEDVCERALEALFKRAVARPQHSTNGLAELIEHDRHMLDNKRRPAEALNCETVFYWRCLAQFVVAQAADDAERDEVGHTLLPTLTDFADFFQTYMQSISKARETPDYEAAPDMTNPYKSEFICLQLLKIVTLIEPIDDSASQRWMSVLEATIQDPATTVNVLEKLVEHYLANRDERRPLDDSIIALCEMMSGMREMAPAKEGDMADGDMHDESADDMFAATTTFADELPTILRTPARNRNESAVVLKDDAETLLRCLTIYCTILRSPDVTKLTAHLKAFLESTVETCLLDKNPWVRNQSYLSVALASTLDPKVAIRYLPLMKKGLAIDVSNVQQTCLAGIFDLILTYGMRMVADVCNTVMDEDEVDESNDDDSVDILLGEFVKLLMNEQNQGPELSALAAEGLCKLLLHGRVRSWGVVSRLIVAWFNPTNRGNNKPLLNVIGRFLPLYAFSSRANQVTIAEGFAESLTVFLSAPTSSPLSSTDPMNVARFMVDLTDFSKLHEDAPDREDGGGSAHLTIVDRICECILADVYGNDVRSLCRCLTMLDFDTAIGRQQRRQLYRSVRTLIETIPESDKQLMKQLTSVLARVEDTDSGVLTAGSSAEDEGDEDSENEENEEPVEGDKSSDEEENVQSPSGRKALASVNDKSGRKKCPPSTLRTGMAQLQVLTEDDEGSGDTTGSSPVAVRRSRRQLRTSQTAD